MNETEKALYEGTESELSTLIEILKVVDSINMDEGRVSELQNNRCHVRELVMTRIKRLKEGDYENEIDREWMLNMLKTIP